MQTPTDKASFFQLIEKNKGIIIKICNSYCHNKSDREDLAQEIIYQLWKSGHAFDPDRRFSTWMYRISLNVAISFYRKQTREKAITTLPGELGDLEDKQSASGELEENIIRLQQLIYELKELDRALMILYLESKTYKEIADILGITETNVASKISRIKEKIKQKLITIK